MKHLFKSLSVIALGLAALQAEAKFKVVTTFTVIQDIAQNVAGDAATVESITKPGAEIHEYEPTPKDIVKAQSADLILWNGLNLERWFERFFQNIKNALVKYDPQNADTYQKNAAAYAEKIKQLDKPLREKLSKIPADQRWLVTSEGAFSYLAKDYDLKEGYLWPINAEQQGTPQQVRKLIDLVKKNHIPVVFSESTVSAKPAQQVAKESGAKYGGVLYVDSLSAADGPVPTYIDLLNVTVSTIVKGFEK